MPLSLPKPIRRLLPKTANSAKSKLKHKQNETAQPKGKSIAIIGSGVSGLTCGHYLVGAANIAEVTIFEANDYIGGHVNTIEVALAEKGRRKRRKHTEYSAIDTGFIVFNERTYPNFFRLLHELQVPFQATEMSFSVKNIAAGFEYNGHTINSLLSQRRNVLRPKFWRFVQDIVSFNKQVKALRQEFEKAKALDKDAASKKITNRLTEQTLGDYLDAQNYGELFTDNYLLPMVSAIWSMGLADARQFPLVFFAQFFDNHGLLDVVNRPRWFTIIGGSKQYVSKLVTRFLAKEGKVLVNSPVQSVIRHEKGVTIEYKQEGTKLTAEFDEVIFACHADTALRLLSDTTSVETEVLGKFRFTANEAILHTDTSILPEKPLAWASWNYLLPDADASAKSAVAEHSTSSEVMDQALTQVKPVLTYHMNILQRLNKRHNYLVTLNQDINPAHVIKQIDYEHPVYDKAMLQAQTRWQEISTMQSHTHFCGAYWFNGFHEDGVKSGLRVCQSLGIDVNIETTVDPKHLDKKMLAAAEADSYKLPVQADKKQRKLKKRHVISATTNQTL
jgi:predicted NAD/FAD-binding protein